MDIDNNKPFETGKCAHCGAMVEVNWIPPEQEYPGASWTKARISWECFDCGAFFSKKDDGCTFEPRENTRGW